MSTLAEIRAHRATAGAAYAAAYAAFKAAWIALYSYDAALTNSKIAAEQAVARFGEQPDVVRFQHAAFLPNTGPSDWGAQATAATNAIVAAFPTPD